MNYLKIYENIILLALKEHRTKKAKTGPENPQYGKPGFATGSKRTEESKKKMGISQKKRFQNKENHPLFGKTHSEETKRKISESLKKKK